MVPAVLIVLCLALAILFIATELTGEMKKATALKGSASLVFVLLGLWCLRQCASPFGRLIVTGLVLGMIGDVLLNMRFLYQGSKSNKVFAAGIFAFLSGHFLYIAALIQRGAPLVPALLLAVVLAFTTIPTLLKNVTAPSKGLKVFGYVYLSVIIVMFSLSVVLLATAGPAPLHILFSLGALLFLVSDFMMIYYSFGKKLKVLRVSNLMLYYIGQCMIACSILLAL